MELNLDELFEIRRVLEIQINQHENELRENEVTQLFHTRLTSERIDSLTSRKRLLLSAWEKINAEIQK